MVTTNPCAAEKTTWAAAGKKFRENEKLIGDLDEQIAKVIALMRTLGRPLPEIEWATGIAQVSSGAEARNAFNQEMALAFGLKGNAHSSRLCSLAAKRGDAVEQRPQLDSDQAAAEKAYRECVERVTIVSRQTCGQPRTGHGHKGEPCQVVLGADASCQYHGTALA